MGVTPGRSAGGLELNEGFRAFGKSMDGNYMSGQAMKGFGETPCAPCGQNYGNGPRFQ